MTTNEGSTTQIPITKDGSVINITSTKNGRVIERFSNGNVEIDKVSVMILIA